MGLFHKPHLLFSFLMYIFFFLHVLVLSAVNGIKEAADSMTEGILSNLQRFKN